MDFRKYFSLQTAIFLAVLIGFIFLMRLRSGGDLSSSSPLLGRTAPDISPNFLDGKSVKLSELSGQVIVLDFWATWCGPCQESLPHLQRLATDSILISRGLKVLTVNAQEAPSDVKAFLDKQGYTFPVAIDGSGYIMHQFGADGLPTTVVIGRDGKVKNVFEGWNDNSAGALDQAIDKALGTKPE